MIATEECSALPVAACALESQQLRQQQQRQQQVQCSSPTDAQVPHSGLLSVNVQPRNIMITAGALGRANMEAY